MKKVIVILLFAVFAVVGLATQSTVANGQEKAPAGPKLSRWHGKIVMFDKDKSTMEVRRENIVKTVHYDSKTKWTKDKGTKVIDMSEFKEGSEMICLGTYSKGSVVLDATNVDLRGQD